MALEVLVFSLLSSYMVAGSDIWTAMYSAEECLDSALLQAAVVADGECVVGALSDGTEASAKFTCAGTGEGSPWSAGVFSGTSCSGFQIMTLEAGDACTCGSSSVFGYAISAYASCAGTVPDCYVNASEPRVWGALYTAADCDSQSLVADATVPYGDCVGGVLPDGTAVSTKFVCHGHTAESAWQAGVYITDDCTGLEVMSLGAADACSCASTSLLGYADVSAYVSCDGIRPDCFERNPTDDKYDDVSDTPVTVSVYSAGSCSEEDVVVTQDTINGLDGCISLSTPLGDVGLVVYCGDDDTYRTELFSSVNCSDDPFTAVTGSSSCVDMATAGSVKIDCANSHDNLGSGGDDDDEMSTSLNVLIIVAGVIVLVAGAVLMYTRFGMRKEGGSVCCGQDCRREAGRSSGEIEENPSGYQEFEEL